MPKFMILPSKDVANIRLLRILTDYTAQEAFRHVTGIIAELENSDAACTWDDIAEQLETQGYEIVKFVQGPSLD